MSKQRTLKREPAAVEVEAPPRRRSDVLLDTPPERLAEYEPERLRAFVLCLQTALRREKYEDRMRAAARFFKEFGEAMEGELDPDEV